MSRSGYEDDIDSRDLNIWRGAVNSAIKGKRGQAFLREMLESLDALPNKRLIAGELVVDGECCAIGAVALKRGVDVSAVDIDEPRQVAKAFGIARALAAEIEYENDEGGAWEQSPEQRFERMRQWVIEQLAEREGT